MSLENSDLISEGLNTDEKRQEMRGLIATIKQRSKDIFPVFKERYLNEITLATRLKDGLVRLLTGFRLTWNAKAYSNSAMRLDFIREVTLYKLSKRRGVLHRERKQDLANKIAGCCVGKKANILYWLVIGLLSMCVLLSHISIRVLIRLIWTVGTLSSLFLSLRIVKIK